MKDEEIYNPCESCSEYGECTQRVVCPERQDYLERIEDYKLMREIAKDEREADKDRREGWQQKERYAENIICIQIQK